LGGIQEEKKEKQTTLIREKRERKEARKGKKEGKGPRPLLQALKTGFLPMRLSRQQRERKDSLASNRARKNQKNAHLAGQRGQTVIKLPEGKLREKRTKIKPLKTSERRDINAMAQP